MKEENVSTKFGMKEQIKQQNSYIPRSSTRHTFASHNGCRHDRLWYRWVLGSHSQPKYRHWHNQRRDMHLYFSLKKRRSGLAAVLIDDSIDGEALIILLPWLLIAAAQSLLVAAVLLLNECMVKASTYSLLKQLACAWVAKQMARRPRSMQGLNMINGDSNLIDNLKKKKEIYK